MCVLDQMRHEKSRSVRRIEGNCVLGSSAVRKVKMLAVKWRFWIALECVFWVRCVMKSRDQRDELKVLECAFGSSAVRKVQMLLVQKRFGLYWSACSRSSDIRKEEMLDVNCVFRVR